MAMAPVRKILAMQVDGTPRVSDSPKRTWMEVVKIDLKRCNRSKWRNIIHVANPNIVGTWL